MSDDRITAFRWKVDTLLKYRTIDYVRERTP